MSAGAVAVALAAGTVRPVLTESPRENADGAARTCSQQVWARATAATAYIRARRPSLSNRPSP
jgi:hypothetical protein